MEYIHVLGRVLFGGYFIYNGLNHLMKMKMLVGYAQSKNIPMASLAVPLSGLMLIYGGITYLFDFHAFSGSVILILFLLPVTFMMHNFWAIKDEQQKMNEMTNFMKNISLVGALLIFAVLRYTLAVHVPL
jgi:putative oxidoreductase